MTEEYTRIQLARQEELTRLIREELVRVCDQPTEAAVVAPELAAVAVTPTVIQQGPIYATAGSIFRGSRHP